MSSRSNGLFLYRSPDTSFSKSTSRLCEPTTSKLLEIESRGWAQIKDVGQQILRFWVVVLERWSHTLFKDCIFGRRALFDLKEKGFWWQKLVLKLALILLAAKGRKGGVLINLTVSKFLVKDAQNGEFWAQKWFSTSLICASCASYIVCVHTWHSWVCLCNRRFWVSLYEQQS